MNRLAFLWWLLGKLADIRDFFRNLNPKVREEKRQEREREEENEIYGEE